MACRMLLANLMLALAAGSAAAQDVRLYGPTESVDPQEVAAVLGQSGTHPPAIKMRSLRVLDDDDTSSVPDAQVLRVSATAPPAQLSPSIRPAPAPTDRRRAPAIALPVQFTFNSADILPAARRQLDALAQGIRLLPIIRTVVIEGHTDAAGSELYNEQLSQRRANAVKRYLVAAHGIESARLRAVGMGEYAPLPGRDPNAPENRRVQFRGE